MKLLGAYGAAYIKVAADKKKYIIFKGNPASRPDLSGTRYARENPKVSCFVVGTKEIIEDAAKSTKIAVIAFVAIDIVKECMADHFSLASLGVNVASDILQAAVSVAASVAVGAILISGGLPVVVTFAAVVGAGVFVGMGLSYVDDRFQLTARAQAYMVKLEGTTGSWLQRVEMTFSEAAVDAGRTIRHGASTFIRVWSEQAVAGYTPVAY